MQAPPVLVDSVNMSLKYYQSPIPDNVRLLMKKFWPGALTIVYPAKKDAVTVLVLGGGTKIGIRMPKHWKILKVIKEVGEPILGPSANFHGEETPYKYADINPELLKKVDLIIPGYCKIKKASTVVDCSLEKLKIIRYGAVDL